MNGLVNGIEMGKKEAPKHLPYKFTRSSLFRIES